MAHSQTLVDWIDGRKKLKRWKTRVGGSVLKLAGVLQGDVMDGRREAEKQ